jgi:hypothetical protein
VSFSTTSYQHRVIALNAAQTRYQVTIPSNHRSLKSVFMFFRRTGIDRDINAIDRYSTFEPVNISNFQMRINSVNLKANPLSGAAGVLEFWEDASASLGPKFQKCEWQNSSDYENGTRFFINTPLTSFPDAHSVVSGVNTNANHSSLVIDFQLDTAPVGIELILYLAADSLIAFDSKTNSLSHVE